jgi:hypothetical protein
MDKIKELKGPVWVVLAGSVVAIGLSVVGIIRSDKRLSELPAAFITLGVLVLGAVVMMYAVHCVHKGQCTVFSWILAIFFALLWILPTGLFARLGFSSIQNILQSAVNTAKGVTDTTTK